MIHRCKFHLMLVLEVESKPLQLNPSSPMQKKVLKTLQIEDLLYKRSIKVINLHILTYPLYEVEYLM